MTNDERFLLASLKGDPHAAPPGDWNRLLRLAVRHGATAYVCQFLDGAVPPPVAAESRLHARAVALRNLALTAELLHVVGAFESAGVPVLPFKGPVLAALLDGEQSLRDYGDIDLLVRPSDADRAFNLLAGLGYETPDGVETWFFRCGRQRQFVKKGSGAVVDVHWSLMPASFAGDAGDESVWDRRGSVRIGGREVPALGDEDLALFLCVHGTKHRWDSLSWLRDVARLLQVRPEIAWSRVAARARRTGTRRMLLLGLWLAHGVMGAPAPSALLAEASRDRTVQVLAAEIQTNWFREPARAAGVWAGMRYWWRASERWRERWRLVRGTFFEPMPADRLAYRLPRALWPAYPLLRPFRLTWKHARRAAVGVSRITRNAAHEMSEHVH